MANVTIDFIVEGMLRWNVTEQAVSHYIVVPSFIKSVDDSVIEYLLTNNFMTKIDADYYLTEYGVSVGVSLNEIIEF